ncbi:rab-GTPase-TBC domain-containing protein [Helicostylum pulchrum]|nr:rab-GTPase-TBC domain-containing protein [Helicostylum pulchrum]
MSQPSAVPEHHVHVEPSVINDFDLDVVDEALHHPDKPEYIDHFGFTVQVKTDNEYDADTTDSEYEDASSLKNKSPPPPQQDTAEDPVLPDSCSSSIINANEDWQLISSTPIKPSTSYYDMLVSKCTRSSNDTQKQVQLKQETSHNLELLKEKSLQQEETDWEFWSNVISDFDGVRSTEQAKFRRLLGVGVPSSLRGMLWQIFSNSKSNSELIENEYRELLNSTSTHEKLIRRDLSRTFPNLDYFKEPGGEGQEMLFNVIKAYSLFDPQVGYCQGLHFVVGVLLLHMPDEAAFCVLIKLMSHYGLRGQFTPQMETLHERLFQFNQLLLHFLPQVHRHLDAQGVLATMYASQWFMTLFAYRCPLDLVFRVFDLVFVEGSQIAINFALALMKKNQQVILSLEFESLLEFFSSNIFDAYKDNAYQFVQDAYSFSISSRLLQKLSKQYVQEAAKVAKIQSIEDNMKRENIELTEQVKKLKKSYRTLELEHQDVAKQVIDAKMSMASLAAENQQLKHELNQMKHEMVKIKATMDDECHYRFSDLASKNAQLVGDNSELQDRLSELESALIDMKLKYAESENDFEVMKQKLQEAQKLSLFKK